MGRALKEPVKALGFKRAIDLMHRTGTRLVRMHTTASPTGHAYYVVPGGYVEPDVAQKIKEYPGAVAGDDGLFPGCDQTWTVKTS